MNEHSPEDLEKARKAKRIIYLVMGVFIVLPIVIAMSQWIKD